MALFSNVFDRKPLHHDEKRLFTRSRERGARPNSQHLRGLLPCRLKIEKMRLANKVCEPPMIAGIDP
jgi:hypothetical protein